MSGRLRRNAPLTADESARAQRLLALLHGRFGELSFRERRQVEFGSEEAG
jgi:hypothetical protein